MIGAHFHNADFVVDAGFLRFGVSALLVLLDLLNTSTRNEARHESHKLRVLHVRLAHRSLFVSESLVFAVGVPLIVGLVVSVILLERVVKVSVQPVELGDNTQVGGHRGVFVGLVLVALADGVESLVSIRVHNSVSPVVVSLLSEVLGEVGRIEIDR